MPVNMTGFNTLADVIVPEEVKEEKVAAPPEKGTINKQITEDYKKIEEAMFQWLLESSNKMGNSITVERMDKLRVVANHHAKALFLSVTGEADRVCAKLLEAVQDLLKTVNRRLDVLEGEVKFLSEE